MRTPSPTSASSHSVAAAALLQLSQTPPRLAGDTGTPRSLEQSSNDAPSPLFKSSEHGNQVDSNVETRKIPEGNILTLSSPGPDSGGVIKISISDDEDVNVQACNIHGDGIDAPQAPYAGLRNGTRLPEAPTTESSAKARKSTFTPGPIVKKRPKNAPSYRSPYTSVEDPRSMSVATSAFAHPNAGPGQLDTQASQPVYPILTVAPDEPESYIRHTTSFGEQGHETLLRHASAPLHLSNQAPQQTGPHPLPSHGSMMGQRHMSQPTLPSQLMLPSVIIVAQATQQAEQTFPSIEEPRAQCGSYDVLVPCRATSERVEARSKVQIFRASPRAPAPKRVRVHPKSQKITSLRYGFGPKQIDIRDFKYRTIKAINMPARTDATPGQPPPEPTPDSQPYGEGVDYRASVLIHWCDDLELAYNETVRRYRMKFPDERTITEDTVRKRHILFLEKLARKYGLKPEQEIEDPGGRVAIRGKQLGHKYNTINGVHVYSAAAGHDAAGTIRRRRAGNEPTEHRGFLKACICVWKDTANASFEEIKLRLEKDYGWNIGENTVKKLFYSERARVYDTLNESGAIDQEAYIKTTDEDLDQLRLHFQYRQAFLLRTSGGQVPAKDVAYMQQLEQLIASKEQEQLQRAQQMGNDPIQTIDGVIEEVHDGGKAEEVVDQDVMMQDADTSRASNQDVD